MSDNEDATAPLWNSEVLSVQHSVSEPIPEFDQPSKDGSKVPSAARRQDTGDVLPDQPAGPFAISKAEKLERQVATVVIQSASEPCDRERLARGSADKNVNWSVVICFNGRKVAVAWDVWIMVSKDGARERFDL